MTSSDSLYHKVRRFPKMSSSISDAVVICSPISSSEGITYSELLRARDKNQGCFKTSTILILFVTSISSIFLSKSRAPGGISEGIVNFPIRTFSNNNSTFSASNGSLPAKSAYRIIPHDQTSAVGPS